MATELEVLATIKRDSGLARKADTDDDFRAVLAVVRRLDADGYLLGYAPHRTSQTKEGEIDFFRVSRLSQEGEKRLEELRQAR